jgi:hypothetical protein
VFTLPLASRLTHSAKEHARNTANIFAYHGFLCLFTPGNGNRPRGHFVTATQKPAKADRREVTIFNNFYRAARSSKYIVTT